jgi:hypothetical protein
LKSLKNLKYLDARSTKISEISGKELPLEKLKIGSNEIRVCEERRRKEGGKREAKEAQGGERL